MRAALAVAVTALVAAAVLWPAVAFPDGDDFPLSPYPMFARDRGRASSIATVVGVGPDGGRHRLSPQLVNGTREIVQAAAVVASEVAAGNAPRLCHEVAARVAARRTSGAGTEARALEAVEVTTETYDAVAWFDGHREPAHRVVHATCPVPGP